MERRISLVVTPLCLLAAVCFGFAASIALNKGETTYAAWLFVGAGWMGRSFVVSLKVALTGRQ